MALDEGLKGTCFAELRNSFKLRLDSSGVNGLCVSAPDGQLLQGPTFQGQGRTLGRLEAHDCTRLNFLVQ